MYVYFIFIYICFWDQRVIILFQHNYTQCYLSVIFLNTSTFIKLNVHFPIYSTSRTHKIFEGHNSRIFPGLNDIFENANPRKLCASKILRYNYGIFIFMISRYRPCQTSYIYLFHLSFRTLSA